MANLVLTGPSSLRWSKTEGLLGWGDYLVGYTDGRFAMVRYAFSIDTPLVKLSLKFTDEPYGTIFSHYGGTDYRKTKNSFGFYISQKNHKTDGFTKSELGLPGMTKELSGYLNFTDTNYKEIIGELDLSEKPLPAGEYYIYIHNFTKTWGCMCWSGRVTSEVYKHPASYCTYDSYTAPKAPQVFQFQGDVLSTGFTVKWSGATGGTNNPITGYEIFLSHDNQDDKSIAILDENVSSYQYQFNSNLEGRQITVSIRTVGTQEIAKYSEKIPINGTVNIRPSAPTILKNYNGDGVYRSALIKLTPVSNSGDDDNLIYQYKRNGEDWQRLQDSYLQTAVTQDTNFTFRAYDGKEYGESFQLTVYCYPELIIEEVSSIIYGNRVDTIRYKTSANCVALSGDGKETFNFKGDEEQEINFISKFGLSKNIELIFYPIDKNGEILNLTNEGFPKKEISTPEEPTKENIYIYDQWDDGCILNSEAEQCSHFYKKIRVRVPKFDSRVEGWDSFILFGGTSQLATKSVDDDGYIRFQAEFESTANQSEKELWLKLGNTYTIFLGMIGRIAKFPFGGFEIINNANVYENKDIKTSFGYNSKDAKQSYGIDDTCPWLMKVSFGSKILEAQTASIESSSGDSDNTKTMIWKNFASEGNFNELGILSSSYFGTKNFNVSVGVTNLYGDTLWKTGIYTGNFNKKPELTALSFSFKKDNGVFASPESSFKFLEGMTLQVTYSIKKWTAESLPLNIYSNDGGILLHTFKDEVLSDGEMVVCPNSFGGSESSNLTTTFILPQILQEEDWHLLLNKGEVGEFVGNEYPTYPVLPKSVALSGFSYSDGTYSLINDELIPETENNIIKKLRIDGKDYNLGTDDKVSFTTDDPMSNKDFIYGSLVIEETVTNLGYTLTKNWVSSTVVIYNIVPTVSYRKNHLGINTLSPSVHDDSIVYIGSYGERNKIYFVNSENQIRTIDIESGGINGFVVDCGSWTGIPGGLVSAGLATIAYTGDIEDLEQKTDTIIILSGGSSEI